MQTEPDGFTILPENPAPELAQSFWYDGPDGRRLRAMFAPASSRFASCRGTVILCPGRTEFIEKYFEVACDLQSRGFAVLAFDWPGQGLSARDLPDGLAGHVSSYQVFVEALEMGVAAIRPRLVEPFVLLAHSMGGAISLEALRSHRLEVEAAAFSAPLWGLKLPPFAVTIARTLCMIGQGKSVTSSHKLDETFEDNDVTNDEQRWGIYRALIAANPSLALGSVTWGWVQATLKLFDNFRDLQALDGLDFPILVGSAENELLVDNDAHDEFVHRLPKAELLRIEGAKHELLMETDERRDQFWAAFDRLLDRANI